VIRLIATAVPLLKARDDSEAGADGTVTEAPTKRVQFRHPDSGEDAHGFVHTSGEQGATIVDEHGEMHKVEHGHYMHHADEHQTPKIDRDHMVAVARKHLELGPPAKLSLMAAAILLSAAGVKGAHTLQASDVIAKNGVAIVHDSRIEDEALSSVLESLAQGEGPLFQVEGEPITAEDLTAYVTKFGQPGETMAKAAAGAMTISIVSEPKTTWLEGKHQCEFRTNAMGMSWLTVRGGGLHLPYHEVVPSLMKARQTARDMVQDLRDGKIPHKGVFRADGR
jgi:hypothetical protein